MGSRFTTSTVANAQLPNPLLMLSSTLEPRDSSIGLVLYPTWLVTGFKRCEPELWLTSAQEVDDVLTILSRTVDTIAMAEATAETDARRDILTHGGNVNVGGT